MSYSVSDWYDPEKPQIFYAESSNDTTAASAIYFINSQIGGFTSDGVEMDVDYSVDGNVSPGFCGSRNFTASLYDLAYLFPNGSSADSIKTFVGVETEVASWRTTAVISGVEEYCWYKNANNDEYVGTSNGLYKNGTLLWSDSSYVTIDAIFTISSDTSGFYFISHSGSTCKYFYVDSSDNVGSGVTTTSPMAVASKDNHFSFVRKNYGGGSTTLSGVCGMFNATTYSEYECGNLGKFYLDSYSYDVQRGIYSVSCFDAMSKFDKSVIDLINSLSSTFTAKTLFTSICTQAGVPYTTYGLSLMSSTSFDKDSVFATDGLTLRDMYMYLAEYHGMIGYIDGNGNATFEIISMWAGSGQQIPLTAIASGSRIKGIKVYVPKQVRAYTSTGSLVTQSAMTEIEEYYESTGNVLLYNDTLGVDCCDRIYTRLWQLPSTYYAQSMELVEINPLLSVPPWIYIEGEGNTNRFPMTSFSYRFNVRGKGTIESGGTEHREPSSTEKANAQAGASAATILYASRNAVAPTNVTSGWEVTTGGYYNLSSFVVVDMAIKHTGALSSGNFKLCELPASLNGEVPLSISSLTDIMRMYDDGSVYLYVQVGSSGTAQTYYVTGIYRRA